MRSLRLFLATVVLLVLPGALSPARCAPAPAAQAGQDSMTAQDGVSAVEERRLQHLFWAYNAIWLLLGTYVVSLGVRLRSVKRELARLEHRLQQASTSSSSGP
jgi:CcmD family protein